MKNEKPKKPLELKKKLLTALRIIGAKMNIIYAVLLVAALAYALVGLNFILNRADDEDYRIQKQSSSPTKFDTETIERLKNLEQSNAAPSQTLPPGRYNPFAE